MNYHALIQSLLKIHTEAKSEAAGAVNRFLILRNWFTGAYLVEFEQNGEDRAEYGSHLIQRTAADLKSHGVGGLGVSMLKDCRMVYRLYPQIRQAAIGEFPTTYSGAIRQSLIGEFVMKLDQANPIADASPQPPLLALPLLMRLSWTHLLEIIRLDDPWKRAFYENECLTGNWSVRQLKRQIGSLLYERTGLSSDKNSVIKHARLQGQNTPFEMSALIRDPYILEFTGLAEKPRYLEDDLEAALLDHLQGFLLELGSGFCFEARQKRITMENEHDYIDLVFYHRKLRCHLLVDLKIRKFQHGDAGQMNFYLNYWKDCEMDAGDNPPIGLILCAGKSSAKAQYATAGIDHQLFVSRYLVELPKPEELQALVENDRVFQNLHNPKRP